jgi:hypothetical protein
VIIAQRLVECPFAQPFTSAVKAEAFERDVVCPTVARKKRFAGIRQTLHERSNPQFGALGAVEPLVEICKILILAMTVLIAPDFWGIGERGHGRSGCRALDDRVGKIFLGFCCVSQADS